MASTLPMLLVAGLMLCSAYAGNRWLADHLTDSSDKLEQRLVRKASRAIEQQTARTVAAVADGAIRQLELYLRLHPEATLEQLLADPTFADLAVQSVGRGGYTAVVADGPARIVAHRYDQFEGQATAEMAETNPRLKLALEGALRGEACDLHYRWVDPNGRQAGKFLHVAPVEGQTADGQRLALAATLYADEFNRPEQSIVAMVRNHRRSLAGDLGSIHWLSGVLATGYGLAAMVLAAGCTLRIVRFISCRVDHLVEVADSIAHGQVPREPADPSNDELGRLGRALGVMARKLTTKQRELLSLNQQLEQRVAERTRDVSRTNRKLEEALAERNASAASLAEQLQFVSVLLDTLPSPLFYKDSQGVYRNCNRAFADDVIGLPREEILGKTLFDLDTRIPHDLAKTYHQKDLDLMNSQGEQSYEANVKLNDGRTGEFLFRKAAVVQADGEVAGLIGVMLDITDRKQAEQRLCRQERQVRAILENIGDGVVTTGAGGEIEMLNPAAERLTGWSQDQARGRRLDDLLDLRDEDAGEPVAPTDLSGQSGPDIEGMLRQLVLIRRDGESRPVSLHAAPIPGDEHQPGGTVISCRDESHQRALQRERSRLLSDLSERVKELHCLVALGEVVEQEGLALTELLGKAIALLPEAMQHAEMAGADMSYQDWSCSTRVCPAGADVLEAELIVRDTPMGTLRVFYDQPCPPADEGPFLENERMLINAFAERLGRVIERLEYQRELTEVRAAVDSANDAALLLDSRHRPRYMNRAFRTMFECWEYTHCNAPACMFERPEDREDLLTACRQNLSWQREMPLKTCTGRTFQGHLRVTSIRDRGQSIGTLVMATDLTERHRMEAQLRHSQKLSAVGQLASGIAHEINTPTQFVGDNLRFLQEHLSGVLARLEQMQQCLGQTDESTRDADIQLLRRALDEMDLAFLTREVPDALSQSVEGMDRIASIVGAMKDFSHNPSPGQFSQVDVGRMIRSTVTLARNEWKYCAEVHLDLPDDLPPVNCMADEISQVILNLLSNAAQALREVKDTKGSSGRIDISARQADEEMVIQVTDNGPGICDDVRERIFEPFFTTKEVGKGTGQGLAIAHATVVEGHQGSIAVDSQPGEGSTFTVRLPFDPTGFASQAKESVDGP